MPNQEGQSYDPNQAPKGSVKCWLKTALDGYFDDDAGRWAFVPLELEIGRHADLAHDLKVVYNTLSATAKLRWRGAVVDLLAEQGGDPRYGKATSVLIDLAVLMPAFEVLEVLPGVVANADARDDAWLVYDHIVSAAIELSRQTEAARDCLESLRTSPSFSSTYAGLIFIALCRTAPDRWPDHATRMRPALQTLMTKLGPDSDAPRWYAESFLRAVALAGVDRGLSGFLRYGKPAGDWLWNQLFKGERSLVGLDESENIYLRDEPSVSLSLSDYGPVEPTCPQKSLRARRWLSSIRAESDSVGLSARIIAERDWVPSDRAVT